MKYANRYFKLVKKYIGRVIDIAELNAQNMSLKMDLEQLKKNHEKELKQKEEEIRKLNVKHETQLKRNEILRNDNVGMYRVVKRKDKTIEKLKETIHELEVRLK
jgi:UDP-galactopyranose mutase